jgi:cell division protein ZipA
MGDFSWALRLALLLIGVAVVAAVYIMGIVRRRNRNRNYGGSVKAWRRSASAGGPDFGDDGQLDRDPTDDEVIAVRVRKIEPLPDLPIIKNEAAAEQPAPQAPMPQDSPPERTGRSGRRAGRRKTSQLDFSFGDAGTADEAPPPALRAPVAPPEPTILTLYLRPVYGPAFVGPSIVRNVNAVGMRHGELQIFHHYGAGDLRTEQCLFSLANMFEPGNFDLQRIEAFQTAGLVMFLNLPAPLDGPVAFELFLNTAQRLAEGLQGELLSDPKTPLDSASIDQMRRTAARFVTHDP